MPRKKNNEDNGQETDVVRRLNALLSVLINQAQFQEYTQAQKIKYLSAFNFSNPEIASILNTTLKTVEAQKYKKQAKRTGSE
jgi:hypothetical protein